MKPGSTLDLPSDTAEQCWFRLLLQGPPTSNFLFLQEEINVKMLKQGNEFKGGSADFVVVNSLSNKPHPGRVTCCHCRVTAAGSGGWLVGRGQLGPAEFFGFLMTG